jgi:polysaccharide biosynthesis/export protein
LEPAFAVLTGDVMNRRAVGLLLFCVTLYQPVRAAQKTQAPTPLPADAVTADPDPAALEFWTSGRYRLTPSDVIELTFPYVSEFDQVLTVQPDGYISLRGVGELRVQSRSLPEVRQMLHEAYAPIIRDPVMTIVLKEFEKPYFVATGEVQHPGKFELRGATTVTQALAFAGGMTKSAKHSQVVIFRRYSNDLVEVKQVDVKQMLASRDLSEDPILRPGDTVFVPRNKLSVIAPFLPRPGLYLDPVTLFR